jgi:hypothetical protein
MMAKINVNGLLFKNVNKIIKKENCFFLSPFKDNDVLDIYYNKWTWCNQIFI